MKTKTMIEIILILTVIGFLAGCGGGDDKFGTGTPLLPVTPGGTSVSEKMANAKSYLNQGTTSSYQNAYSILAELETNPNYSPTPEQKLQIRTGIKYAETKIGTADISSPSTSTYLENIIFNASGVTIPKDTYFLLASSYFQQGRHSETLTMIMEIGKGTGSVFVDDFTYSSEFNMATDGDCHAFMALVYYLTDPTANYQKALTQKNIAQNRSMSALGSEYIARFNDLGL
ncbi:MAG: hypothetical protein WC337_11055 [Candidatus Muiribacteriota bacterium]|jgi:hypothetical protein